MIDCVILVGGRGSRLGSITKKSPKPLLKIKCFSFIDYLLWHVCKFNIKNIYLIASYKANQFLEIYNKKKIFNTKIKVIIEKKRNGTAGALFTIKKKIKNDFILMNGDSFLNINLDKFCKISQKKNSLINLALIKNKNYKSNKKLNSLDIDSNCKIFFKKNKYMNAGIYFLKKEFLKMIHNTETSLENDVLPNLIINKKVTGKIYKRKFFIDIGTKKNLILAKKKLLFYNKNKAFLLDRDGVINEDRGYIYKIKDFKILKGTIEAIKFLNKNKYIVCIVTNQSGIGRGLYKEKDLQKLHEYFQNKLKKYGAQIDNFYFCPYHEIGGIGKYKKKSYFRKPNPGMLIQAINDFHLNRKKVIMIGDKITDKQAAENAKVKFYYKEKISLYSQVKKIIFKNK